MLSNFDPLDFVFTPNSIKNHWVILLTTAINPFGKNNLKEISYRRKLYCKQIQRWLSETSYEIFLTESTGYDIDCINNQRLHKINFNLMQEIGYLSSSSTYESYSFIKFMDYFQQTSWYNNTTHIFKVTGRYFLSSLEQTLLNLDGYDIYLQKRKSTNWQNTEYFGIHKDLLLKLAQKNIKQPKCLEHTLYEFIMEYKLNKIILSPFQNDVPRGGDNILLNPL